MQTPENTQGRPPRRLGPAGFFLAGAAIVAIMICAMSLGGRHVVFGSINARVVDDGGVELALAKRAAELGIAGAIPDTELKALTDAMRAKAAAGDTRAALFVLEVAKLQRAAERAKG